VHRHPRPAGKVAVLGRFWRIRLVHWVADC
jgi:hypothetical protein